MYDEATEVFPLKVEWFPFSIGLISSLHRFVSKYVSAFHGNNQRYTMVSPALFPYMSFGKRSKWRNIRWPAPINAHLNNKELSAIQTNSVRYNTCLRNFKRPAITYFYKNATT